VLAGDVHHHALVVRVDERAVDGGAEGAGGVAADPPAEDDLDVLRAAQVQVVGDQRLEERPGPVRGVEDDGPGDLDLGCGRGLYTPELARRGWEAVGIDYVPAAIEAAVAKSGGMDGLRYVVGDVTRLP
jgi:SAM-dependent methyltransferase